MSLFTLDGDDDRRPRIGPSRNLKFFIAVCAVVVLIGTSLAKSITINSNKSIEFGQGSFRVAACDGFVSVNLYPTAALYGGYSRIQTVEIVGLNPTKCNNKIMRFRVYGASGNTPLNLYVGPVAPASAQSGTSTQTIDSATTVTVFDTSTVFSGTSADAGFPAYAAKALTLIDQSGVNIGYYSDYLSISYNKSTASYKIYLAQPLCLMKDVYRITIETAPLT
jgi:hypothetical protein